MNEKKNIAIGIGIFGALIVLATIFSFVGKETPLKAAELTVWGIVPAEQMAPSIAAFEQFVQGARIDYVEQRADNYSAELLNALASGAGPDLWIMDQDELRTHLDKVLPLPPTLFTTNEFRTTFVDIANVVHVLPDGSGSKRIFALPLWSDPLVLYWNRSLFNTAGIALPPQDWDAFLDFSQQLTARDNSGNITTAGSAMGRAINIERFREILGMLFLQQGVDIVNPDGTVTFSEKERRGDALLNPTESVVRFYTDFANPGRSSYTWNPALSSPDAMFAEGRLGMMFDYASRVPSITEKNPHLSFDIARAPQLVDSDIPVTVSRLPGITVNKFTAEPIAAWQFALWLTAPEQAKLLIGESTVAPATRSLLTGTSERPYWPVLQQSTLQASWLNDPVPTKTTPVLRDMIKSITDGASIIEVAVREAGLKIQQLVR